MSQSVRLLLTVAGSMWWSWGNLMISAPSLSPPPLVLVLYLVLYCGVPLVRSVRPGCFSRGLQRAVVIIIASAYFTCAHSYQRDFCSGNLDWRRNDCQIVRLFPRKNSSPKKAFEETDFRTCIAQNCVKCSVVVRNSLCFFFKY